MVRPARELAGLIEIRGLGIRRIEHVGEAVVGLVVDLGRCPTPSGCLRRKRSPPRLMVSNYREFP